TEEGGGSSEEGALGSSSSSVDGSPGFTALGSSSSSSGPGPGDTWPSESVLGGRGREPPVRSSWSTAPSSSLSGLRPESASRSGESGPDAVWSASWLRVSAASSSLLDSSPQPAASSTQPT